MAQSRSPRQKRLVRDYSTDGIMTPPTQFHTYADEDRLRRSDRESPGHEDAHKISEEIEETQDLTNDVVVPVAPVATPDIHERSTSTRTMVSAASDVKMANFFGSEVFHLVLQNPTTAYQLKRYAQSRLCEENLEFLDMVGTLSCC